jgi:phage shock protein PspC (stress-responsive transcriptional regulator)
MKKLYRSRSDRILGGVCGGLAQYLGVDSNLLRFLILISVFINGLGVIFYLAALVIVPEEPVADGEIANGTQNLSSFSWQSYKSVKFWGYLFIFTGLILLLKTTGILNFALFYYLNWGIVLGLLFMALGLYLLYKKDEVDDIEQEMEQVKRKFYKKSEGKMIAGVCAGLADALNIDISVMRVLWILLSIFSSGIFIIIYFILAIFLPVKETSAEDSDNESKIAPVD